jgi:hypothetical protein
MRIIRMLTAVSLCALAATQTAHAGLIGAGVTYEYLVPTTSDVVDMMGPTTITSSTSFVDNNLDAFITTTFNDLQIIITNTPPSFSDNFPADVAFDGPSYLFSNVTISNVTTDPASATDFEGAVSFTSDNVMVNFAVLGASDLIPNGNKLILDVTTTAAAVPEPSTWAMMALGFAGLGFLGYRKTRSDNALA